MSTDDKSDSSLGASSIDCAIDEAKMKSSADLASAIKSADFSDRSATIIGYGTMGRHYVQALQALGVGRIQVYSRSAKPLAELHDAPGISTISGGYRKLETFAEPDDLAIVAAPTADLVSASKYLVEHRFRKILIEKPVSLWSQEIRELTNFFEKSEVDAICAYNRVAYPSLQEARFLTERDGGVTSCAYELTEFVDRIGPDEFTKDELARWGIANSLHVISMAHALIGNPLSWSGSHTGDSVEWHPTGSVFVGSAISANNIPFVYHGDWGSKGRWSVEFRTHKHTYRLRPLEQLFAKSSALGEWKEVEITTFNPAVKTGIAEQVAAMFELKIREILPLVSMNQAAELTYFGEELFGYSAERQHINTQ